VEAWAIQQGWKREEWAKSKKSVGTGKEMVKHDDALAAAFEEDIRGRSGL
jgi:hypothetical protein